MGVFLWPSPRRVRRLPVARRKTPKAVVRNRLRSSDASRLSVGRWRRERRASPPSRRYRPLTRSASWHTPTISTRCAAFCNNTPTRKSPTWWPAAKSAKTPQSTGCAPFSTATTWVIFGWGCCCKMLRTSSRWSGCATMPISSMACTSSKAAMLCSSTVRPPTDVNCLGRVLPKRLPVPPARMRAMVWDMGERRRKSGTFLRVVRRKRPVWGSGRCVAGENGREWGQGPIYPKMW